MLNQIVLLLTIVSMYNFLQLRFLFATLIGWLNVINYVVVAGFIQEGLAEPKMTFFLSNVFFCIIANILGCLAPIRLSYTKGVTLCSAS